MIKKSKKQAIREYCLSCSGDSPKEVTLCHILDCPLWPYRIGPFVSASAYRTRIDKAFKNHPEEVAMLAKAGLSKKDFLQFPHQPAGSRDEDGNES